MFPLNYTSRALRKLSLWNTLYTSRLQEDIHRTLPHNQVYYEQNKPWKQTENQLIPNCSCTNTTTRGRWKKKTAKLHLTTLHIQFALTYINLLIDQHQVSFHKINAISRGKYMTIKEYITQLWSGKLSCEALYKEINIHRRGNEYWCLHVKTESLEKYDTNVN